MNFHHLLHKFVRLWQVIDTGELTTTFYSDNPLPTSLSKACHNLGSDNWAVCVVEM